MPRLTRAFVTINAAASGVGEWRRIDYGLQRFAREQYQLFIERTTLWTVHAITSPRYAFWRRGSPRSES
jgi:hypothetical protein